MEKNNCQKREKQDKNNQRNKTNNQNENSCKASGIVKRRGIDPAAGWYYGKIYANVPLLYAPISVSKMITP